jgi:hypothetical protein
VAFGRVQRGRRIIGTSGGALVGNPRGSSGSNPWRAQNAACAAWSSRGRPRCLHRRSARASARGHHVTERDRLPGAYQIAAPPNSEPPRSTDSPSAGTAEELATNTSGSASFIRRFTVEAKSGVSRPSCRRRTARTSASRERLRMRQRVPRRHRRFHRQRSASPPPQSRSPDPRASTPGRSDRRG